MFLRRLRPSLAGLVCLLAGLLTVGISVRAPRPAPLARDIDTILQREEVRSALWGIQVVDLTTGRTLYQRNASLAMMPASNMKLFSTAAALDLLGGDFRYRTTLFFDGERDGSTLRGDLLVEGSGDPTFGSNEVDALDPLQHWAAQLAEQGVTRIEGRIIGDDNVFDDAPYSDGWDVSFIGTEPWAPPAGGLSYHDNLVEVRIDASRSGRSPVLDMDPPDFFTVQNKVTTRGRRSASTMRVYRPLGHDQIVLDGALRQAYRGTLRLPVSDPTAFTLHAFAQHLEAAGIKVEATLVDVDDLPERPSYESAEPLLVYASPPLRDLIPIINKESNNFYAEQLFRTFGWGGSAEGAERRAQEMLERLGAPVAGLSLEDGSGLSRKDMVTPAAVAGLLQAMYRHDARSVYVASLPSGGENNTTLEYRLAGVPVQAKTGSLRYVRALSGYAYTPDGRPLAFSILANNYSGPSYRIMQAIDDVVLALTQQGAG